MPIFRKKCPEGEVMRLPRMGSLSRHDPALRPPAMERWRDAAPGWPVKTLVLTRIQRYPVFVPFSILSTNGQDASHRWADEKPCLNN